MDWKKLVTSVKAPDFVGEKEEAFKKLHDLFVDWNSKINLSAIRDEKGIYEKHFIDSILSAKYFDAGWNS